VTDKLHLPFQGVLVHCRYPWVTQLPDDRFVVLGGRSKDGGVPTRSLEVIDFKAGTVVLRNHTLLNQGNIYYPAGRSGGNKKRALILLRGMPDSARWSSISSFCKVLWSLLSCKKAYHHIWHFVLLAVAALIGIAVLM
jgi:hypothetical protein